MLWLQRKESHLWPSGYEPDALLLSYAAEKLLVGPTTRAVGDCRRPCLAIANQHGWGLVEDTALQSSGTLGANPHACWFRDLAPGWFVGLYPARRLQQIWQYAQNDRKRYGHCTNQNLFCQCFFVHFYLLGLGQSSGGTTTHHTAL